VAVGPDARRHHFWNRQPVRKADFIIQFGPPKRGAYKVHVLSSPVGETHGTFKIPPKGRDPNPEIAGMSLYRQLFKERVGELLSESRGVTCGRPDSLLSIKLRIDPEDPDMAPLTDLPWESLYDPTRRQFLNLSDDHCVVRDLLAPMRRRKMQFPTFLRILAVACSPTDLQSLDLKKESDKIEQACHSRPGIELTFLEEATSKRLRDALEGEEKKNGGFHVLHFMGHGIWSDNVGKIAFQKANGTKALLSGPELADLISRFVTLQLIVLNACDGGQFKPGQNPFTGVATALILRGFPAVIAMSSTISDPAAIEFSGALYEFLVRGYPVERAITEGRKRVRQIPSPEWPVPTVYMRTSSSWAKSWRNAALGFFVLLILTTVLWIFSHPRPSEATVSINVKEDAAVAVDTTVTGRVTDPSLHYYLLVKDPAGKCWPQTTGPLVLSEDGTWSAVAHFSGRPGEQYELIVIASPRSAKWQSLSNSCGAPVKDLRRYARRVHIGVTPGSTD
jgi:hypothetical protein